MTHDGQPRAVEPEAELDAEFDRLDDEFEGETVVVDRGAAGREAADDEFEGETIVVDRGSGSPAALDLDAPTIVVDRGELDDDAFADQDTFIVGAPAEVDGSTAAAHDDTVVVDRGSQADPALPEASVTADAPVRRRRLGGRRTLEPAPLEPIDLRSSVRAVGAGAVEYYRPRQLPEASPAPASFDAPPAEREPSPGLPSIRRSSRRAAAITLTALTAAVAVGIVGALAVAGLLING